MTDQPHFQEFKKQHLPLIEQQLEAWLTLQEGPQQGLFEAARYCTLGAGKRFRPLLTLAVTSLYGVDLKRALPAACAVELVHTYSLIHDDLPCIDNDDFRRGKKALHKIIGEGLALLTGDFLLTLAFEKLSEASAIEPVIRLQLVKCLAQAAGHTGMVGGQYADLTSHQHPQTREFLNWMHRCKTGALIRASLECGALLAAQDEETISRWGAFGEKIGLLFQLVDDLVDSLPCHVASSCVGPSSYIALAGVEQTLEEVRQIKAQLLEECAELDAGRGILSELVEKVTRQYEELPQIPSAPL